MRSKSLPFFFCGFVALALGRVVYAECINPPPPCDALRLADIVVVADVVEADSVIEEKDGVGRFIPQRVLLNVVERFKGPRPNQRFEQRVQFSIEARILTQGDRWIIYARQRPDGLWDIACGRTKPLKGAESEVWALRKCVVP